MAITTLNHAVLYVSDADRSARFYQDLLGFEVVTADPGGRAVFLRAGGSTNHHDLGLFTIGPQTGGRSPAVGLYHLAWEIPTIEELADLQRRLADAGALVGASDHGVSKSLYGRDPDGIEFEVMWAVPPDQWTDADDAAVRPLDLAAEIARHGST